MIKKEKDIFEVIQIKRKVLIGIKSREMKFLTNLIIFQYYNRQKKKLLYYLYTLRRIRDIYIIND